MKQDKQQTVIFVHVPKTAGQTVDQIMKRQYLPESVFTFKKDITGAYHAFQQREPAENSGYQIIRGHVPYGVHEYIQGPYAYFTFLRDPIERTISHYYFLRRKKSHPLADKLGEDFLPMKELMELGLDKMFFNAHTRLLSGVWYDAEPGECTGEHLALAKDNLRRHFAVIGLTERFDESLMLLQDAFSWKDLHYVRENVTSGRPKRDELSAETLSLVENANLLDKELYAFGQELFDDELKGKEKQIERRVAQLRMANRLHNLIFSIRRRSVRTYVRQRWRKST